MPARVFGRKSHHDASDFTGMATSSFMAPDGNADAGTADTRQIVYHFLAALFGKKPADTFILIWRLRGK